MTWFKTLISFYSLAEISKNSPKNENLKWLPISADFEYEASITHPASWSKWWVTDFYLGGHHPPSKQVHTISCWHDPWLQRWTWDYKGTIYVFIPVVTLFKILAHDQIVLSIGFCITTGNLELLKLVECKSEVLVASTLDNLPQKATNKRKAEPRSRETKRNDPAIPKANFPWEFSIVQNKTKLFPPESAW